MKDIKISQSLLKSLFNYKKGKECGIVVYEKYVNGLELDPSEAMDLGNWFEWRCTQQLPRNGKTPESKKTQKGDLASAYKTMGAQVDNYWRIMKRYDIKSLHTGYSFTQHPYANGIADMIAEMDNEKVIIDIKTSGKIDDRWSEWGWAEEKFENSDSDIAQNLTIQAVHYKVLARYEWGIANMPFYFLVFSQSDEISCKIYRVNVDDERLDKHDQQITAAYQYVNKIFNNPKMEKLAMPEYKRCYECSLKANCQHKIDVPLIKDIYVY